MSPKFLQKTEKVYHLLHSSLTLPLFSASLSNCMPNCVHSSLILITAEDLINKVKFSNEVYEKENRNIILLFRSEFRILTSYSIVHHFKNNLYVMEMSVSM